MGSRWRRFELKGKKPGRFWAIRKGATRFIVHYGQLGSEGQKKEKSFSGKAELTAAYERAIRDKRAKGYKELKASASPPKKSTKGSTAGPKKLVSKKKSRSSKPSKTAKPPRRTKKPKTATKSTAKAAKKPTAARRPKAAKKPTVTKKSKAKKPAISSQPKAARKPPRPKRPTPPKPRPEPTPLVEALLSPDGDRLVRARQLIVEGAPVNPSRRGEMAPLAIAADAGDLELMKLLCDAGADPRSLGPRATLYSPLDSAVSRGDLECVRYLLDHGADVNERDEAGSALHVAVAFGFSEVLELLIERGADLATRDEQGSTALALARSMNRRSLVTLLQSANERPGSRWPMSRPTEPPKNQQELAGVRDFRAEARENPMFNAAKHEIEAATKETAFPWPDFPGGYKLIVDLKKGVSLLEAQAERWLKEGVLLFRTRRNYMEGTDTLALLPTADWKRVLFARQTNGANYGLGPEDIIEWLEDLARAHPFVIEEIGWDTVGGRFASPPKDLAALAEHIYEFCPDIVDQGCETVGRLAQEIEQSQRFWLWWD